MQTAIDHLPEAKRRELAHVVDAVREGFARAIAHRTQPRFRNGQLLKIVLFGSYARGDWVEDPVGRYFSDYDLLVIVDHDDLTDIAEFWEKTENRFLAELSDGTILRTPVSLIYHSLEDVNEKLRLGRYFFMDIVRDGIVLFEEDGYPFADPHPLTAEQALQETRDYFEEWFESAEGFLDTARYALSKGRAKEAAFQLHQATERFYHCLFLVRTLYSPKTHNLNRLRDMAEELEPSLKAVWPRDTRFEKRCYSLLRDAYVKARYSRSYRISAEQLDWIAARVELLKSLVRAACEDRIDDLAKAAEARIREALSHAGYDQHIDEQRQPKPIAHKRRLRSLDEFEPLPWHEKARSSRLLSLSLTELTSMLLAGVAIGLIVALVI